MGFSTCVAYFPATEAARLWEFWPEAREVTVELREAITFTDRFPRPDWWKEETRT